MPMNQDPESLNVILALLISTVSGVIAIMRKVLSGQPASCLWIICEWLTAVFFGCLMHLSYPEVAHLLPDWVTYPVSIAIASHFGGESIKIAKKYISDRCKI